MTGRLPTSASVATSEADGKLHAPAAARNVEALVDLLLRHAPREGTALELASGTGQHAVAFAKNLPDLHWQPTEPDPDRRTSIEAYRAEVPLANLAPAQHLDATATGWGKAHGPRNLIVLVNLLHLITAQETKTLISEAGLALVPAGRLILYGPFSRAGRLTSAGDARFDADLRRANPAIGYKDDRDIRTWLEDSGFGTVDAEEMPANNLAFIATRS